MGMWGQYVPVSVRRSQAKKEMEKLRKKGQKIEPVEITGRQIAMKFWGKKWCDHLESFADYDNRLPRGRTYARNGSICHLAIREGNIEAIVSGSSLYKIWIKIKTLQKSKWDSIKKRCSDHIGSLLEILQGKLSDHVMKVVADHKEGLFPDEKEIEFGCSCPDWADMCKHVAAVFYGIGNRLDDQPDLLFQLRGVDASELVSTKLTVGVKTTDDLLEDRELADIFGIDLEAAPEKKPSQNTPEKKMASPPENGKNPQTIEKTKKSPHKPLNVDTLTGKQLRAVREERGLTVNEFAAILGVTTASIYRWEKLDILSLQFRPRKALSEFLQKSAWFKRGVIVKK